MANKFEKFSSTNNDYQVARDIQQKDALNEKIELGTKSKDKLLNSTKEY
ncbi:hypothetical protein [Lactiplantibacillus plantarum]|nr:hypothetical protein [Lactiplantibacillus plantarum]